ncbi:MAG: hypothetical protein ACTHN5_17785 [Phycisphaerae bacterium]
MSEAQFWIRKKVPTSELVGTFAFLQIGIRVRGEGAGVVHG